MKVSTKSAIYHSFHRSVSWEENALLQLHRFPKQSNYKTSEGEGEKRQRKRFIPGQPLQPKIYLELEPSQVQRFDK